MTAPYIDSTLRRRHGGLLDTLLAVVPQPPDSIVHRAFTPSGTEGSYEYGPRRLTVRDRNNPNPRRVLQHEFGHVLQFDEQPTFFRWFDPEAKGKTPYPEDLERFANAFADALEALARRDTVAARRPQVSMLAEYLASRPPFASDSLLAGLRRRSQGQRR